MSARLLIVVQFCAEDKALAMELARLLADLETAPDPAFDVLFAAQFNAEADKSVVDYVSRKLQVWSFQNWYRVAGWPEGCTGLWEGIMQQVYARSYLPDGRRPWNYDVVFTPEPDSLPLVPDWAQRFLAEWDRKAVYVMGHLLEQPYHINGTAMYSCAEPFLRAVLQELSRKSQWAFGGFDVSMARFFERWGSSDTPLIRSYWRRPGFDLAFRASLIAGGTAWYHGIKTTEGIQTVRRAYGL